MKIDAWNIKNRAKETKNTHKSARFARKLPILEQFGGSESTPKRNAVGSTPITDAKKTTRYCGFFIFTSTYWFFEILKNTKIVNTDLIPISFFSLFCKVIKGKHRFFLRVWDKVAVNFERYRRIAMPHTTATTESNKIWFESHVWIFVISHEVRTYRLDFFEKFIVEQKGQNVSYIDTRNF